VTEVSEELLAIFFLLLGMAELMHCYKNTACLVLRDITGGGKFQDSQNKQSTH